MKKTIDISFSFAVEEGKVMKGIWTFFGIILAASILLFGCTTPKTSSQEPPPGAKIVNRPEWSVGDKWTIKLNAMGSGPITLTVIGRTEKGYILQDQKGRKWLTKAGLFTEQKGVNLLDFPLWVGKYWQTSTVVRTTSGMRDQFTFTRRAEAFEEISVPAGTFSALRIEEDQQNLSRGDMTLGVMRATYWYAPAVKTIIKMEVDRTSAWGYDLISFQLFGKEKVEPTEKERLERMRSKQERTRVAVGPGAPQQIGSGLDTMVQVPAGGFTMGSNDNYANEKPQRRVYLDAFYIDKYPVTNGRFRRFRKPEKDYGSKFNGARQPVVGVTWFQARDYCGSVGKRLPTEAEWEKAARGVDGRKYPWGSDWDGSKVIWSKNSGIKTHPVDRTYNTHRSPYGAVDMSGNVWQWVQDRYGADYYRNAPDRNPKGPASGSGRVVRGGSMSNYFPTWFRAAARGGDGPDAWNYGVGFRCAKAP